MDIPGQISQSLMTAGVVLMAGGFSVVWGGLIFDRSGRAGTAGCLVLLLGVVMRYLALH